MTDHPPYPYSDGTRAILGPDVTATADGQTITWQGATYNRHPGEAHCACGGIDVTHQLSGTATADEGTDANPAELTAEEARGLVDELGLDLYRAQDALEFVEECCVIADREQRTVTTADVREWLKGARCGRELAADGPTCSCGGRFPIHHLNADRHELAESSPAQTTPDNPPASSGTAGNPRQAAFDAVYECIRSTNRIPGNPAYRNAMIWRAVQAALDAAGVPNPPDPTAHDTGPSLADCARDDTRWWGGEKTREQ